VSGPEPLVNRNAGSTPCDALFAVERVPHRQLAHPVLEEHSDAIGLWRRALRHPVGAGRLGQRPRSPVPTLRARWVSGDRDHLSITSREGSEEKALASCVRGERPDRS